MDFNYNFSTKNSDGTSPVCKYCKQLKGNPGKKFHFSLWTTPGNSTCNAPRLYYKDITFAFVINKSAD